MRLLSLVNTLLVNLRSNILWGSLNACRVYFQLFYRGYIRETSKGQYFNLVSELTLLGDLNNMIVYKGTSQLNYHEQMELLSEDETLLTDFKNVSRNLRQKLKGIRTLPMAFSLIINTVLLLITFPYLKEDYYCLINLTLEDLSMNALGVLGHCLFLPLTTLNRYLLPKLIFKLGAILLKIYRWFSNL
ncbi:hypothetical protein [Roseivirga sp.]|uniref:hypothetical protein n=1 Tax=Roseivirga sp. TaxID=1964215 RepID=UPI003B526955